MADHACLVFFRSGRCDLDFAAAALADARLRAVGRGDELAVSYPGSPVFRVSYVAEDYVAEEAVEIAAGNPHAAALLPCDARFEILIDDLDAALDECNTLISVQGALEDATSGFLFNTWNGGFPGRTCNP
jgi:hypothetical protein